MRHRPSINAARVPGARYTKSFNALNAGVQAEAAFRPEPVRAVQWVCGDDEDAKRVVMGLITDAGYVPVDIGGSLTRPSSKHPEGPARSTARNTGCRTPRRSSRR